MYDVMLVDDEKWARISLRHILRITGLPFQIVHECSSGEEALQWLKIYDVDMILCDVDLMRPFMDGIAMTREVKSRKANIEVILISGHENKQFIQDGFLAGAHDYLLKPVEMEELKDSLTIFLEKQGYSSPEHS